MKFSKQFNLYQSEATQFLASLKQQIPDLEEQQKQGRARLWDKEATSLDEQERNKASRLKQQGYVYLNKE